MPAFVAPLVGFALGVLLAFGRAAPPDPRGRPAALAALFSGLVFTPVCAYFLIFSPDWSFAYLVDAARIPSAADLVLLAIDAVSVPAGLMTGGRLMARGSLRAVATLAGAPLAAALLAVLILSPRLAVDGTYRQVHGDFGTRPVAGGPLGYALLWMHAMLAAGFAITARALLARPAEIDAPAPPRRRDDFVFGPPTAESDAPLTPKPRMPRLGRRR